MSTSEIFVDLQQNNLIIFFKLPRLPDMEECFYHVIYKERKFDGVVMLHVVMHNNKVSDEIKALSRFFGYGFLLSSPRKLICAKKAIIMFGKPELALIEVVTETSTLTKAIKIFG